MSVVVTVLAFLAPVVPPGQTATYYCSTPPKHCDLAVGEEALVGVVLDTKGEIVRQARVILVIPPGGVVEAVEATAEIGSYLAEERYEPRPDGSMWIRLTWRPDDPAPVDRVSILTFRVRAMRPGEAHVMSRFTEVQGEDGTVLPKQVNNATKIRVSKEST